LYTHLQVKEDSHTLYGFSSLAERDIFRLLISVSGIGASIARTMLSSLTPKQVREGIASADVALIQSVKGIGAKTAQRVILDLKDKILKIYDIDEVSVSKGNTNKDEALSALEVLGFVKKQAERVVDKIMMSQPDADVETIIKQALKNFNINYPIILTPKEYYALVAKDNLRNYYKDKIDAFDGKKEGSEDERKNLLPDFYVDSGFFESIFGSNVIEMVPQGSVEMDLGVLFSRQDNPSFSPRQRSNFTFDFDQRISLSLLGKVGTRLQVNANYDTQSTFDFQQLIKLEYTPTEDDIIQKIEVGNVNMPLNSSLITGAQSLFGVKAQLQFGRTTVTGVFSEQKSQANTVVAQGGGTLEEFEFFIREYDENRHFFLAHYFRDNYDNSLVNYPFINNKGLQITRLEVWVTNRSNRTENVRNIVAVQDIGESDNVFSAVPVFAGPGTFPDNTNNGFNPLTIDTGGSSLSPQIRDISTADQGFGALSASVKEGSDYAKLENARKLLNGQEYTLN